MYTRHRTGVFLDEIAERCLDKIILVADTALPEVQAQAQAFKDHIRAVLVFYMKEPQTATELQCIMPFLRQGKKT